MIPWPDFAKTSHRHCYQERTPQCILDHGPCHYPVSSPTPRLQQAGELGFVDHSVLLTQSPNHPVQLLHAKARYQSLSAPQMKC